MVYSRIASMVLVLLRVDPILEDEYRISEQNCVAWLQKSEMFLELHSRTLLSGIYCFRIFHR